jgi:hypothetical protein
MRIAMRYVMTGLVVALLFVGLTRSTSATTETISGEVISLSCYFQNPANVGPAGAVCAWATVKYEGNPVGILTADKKVYQLAGGLVANNNARMVPFLGKTVTITGDVTESRGHVMMLTANDVKPAQ